MGKKYDKFVKSMELEDAVRPHMLMSGFAQIVKDKTKYEKFVDDMELENAVTIIDRDDKNA